MRMFQSLSEMQSLTLGISIDVLASSACSSRHATTSQRHHPPSDNQSTASAA